MIKVYAILPSVFNLAYSDMNRERDLDYVWSLFYNNAVLADFANGYWIEYVQRLKLSFGVREKLLIHLMKLNDLHRIVYAAPEIKRRPKSDDDWMRLAVELLESQRIDAIIAPETLRVKLGLKSQKIIDFPIESFGYQGNFLQPIQTSVVLRSKKGLFDALQPIIRFATNLRIVDPYFNCLNGSYEQNYFGALRLIAELLQKNNDANISTSKAYRVVEIYTSKDKSGLPKSRKVLKGLLNEKLLNLASIYDIKIEFHILDSLPGDSKLNKKKDMPHDRFLLTDQFGFSLSQGLTLDSENNERYVIWQLLSENSWKAKMEECTINPHYPTSNNLFIEPSGRAGKNE